MGEANFDVFKHFLFVFSIAGFPREMFKFYYLIVFCWRCWNIIDLNE